MYLLDMAYLVSSCFSYCRRRRSKGNFL